MTLVMLLSVALASNMIVVPNPRPIEQVMRVLQRERATIFPGVPAMYIGIINHPAVAAYDLKSVRCCLSAAAPLPMEVQEQFGRLTGGRLVEGYGLTETSPLTHANPIYGVRKPGSIGIPVPDTEARLVDPETGMPLPSGAAEAGELAIRGPQVMRGYWNRAEDTADCLSADGWLRTGDICTVDDDGYFSIVDRKKDMIIASGYKILPREVEEVLFAHPAVQEAAVVGVPDPYRCETVKAFIVPKASMHPTVEELITHCRASLAPYKVPRLIEFRAELPKTAIGKVLRRVLAAEEQQQSPAQATGAPSV